MLFENTYWIIFKKGKKTPPVAGKWIWEAPRYTFLNMDFVEKMEILINGGQIIAAKFAKKEFNDPFPYLKNSVLCVYTKAPEEPKTKELVSNILGFEPLEWKSEMETKKDWAKNGKLREQYEDYWKKTTNKFFGNPEMENE